MHPSDAIAVGTAGWSLPKTYAPRFPEAGSHLERYGQRFPAVEINSSFYRPHRVTTYAKWAAAVPDGFRFAVKVPRSVTHERRLIGADEPSRASSVRSQVSGRGSGRCCSSSRRVWPSTARPRRPS